MQMDQVYFERMLGALTSTVDGVSTAPLSGNVIVKPIETVAALATLAGRVLAYTEESNGFTYPEEAVALFGETVRHERARAAELFAFARREEGGADAAEPAAEPVA